MTYFLLKTETLLYEKDCTRRTLDGVKKQAKIANRGESVMGVKKYSLVLNYDFDVVEQTPQDIMHVLHEGIARRVSMKFINIWTDTGRVTLSELNFRITNPDFGYTHRKNLIKALSGADLKKHSLIISAGQMHSLILLFPIIFYDILDTNKEEYE